ncbi:hypothetical protein D556_3630 [Bordetella holmesii 41130]|nr:hypothetical protein D558_3629 [Bordetella holmesii 44057]EWM41058.1 hypothetical protein D555_3703 [Bordetella holmesii 35009]EWM42323.1 hypothetical protein D556_3630 [Bordetella holmesii 41130]EWM44947.1 hypothetical protein D557_2936 [Bordetella holmesii 70147]KAK80478.1 hypothetical protein L573_1412 [Bordetella holmesii H620]KAK82526.1 hypothetical protein L503_1406 [Bordetella holmesii CDC-H809-BH]KCV00973.1 hypothetical protein L501_1414 [Bordetella holmesii CDC-H719-BH]KCV15636.1
MLLAAGGPSLSVNIQTITNGNNHDTNCLHDGIFAAASGHSFAQA